MDVNQDQSQAMGQAQSPIAPPAATPAPAPPAAQDQGQQQGQPDPKAMEGVQRLGIAASKIIYDKQTSKALIDMMSKINDPPTAAATAGMVVMRKMQDSISGVNPKVVFAVAPAVVVFLLELGEAAGLWEGAGTDEVSAAIQKIGQFADQGDSEESGEAQQGPAEESGEPANQQPAPQGGGLLSGGMQ